MYSQSLTLFLPSVAGTPYQSREWNKINLQGKLSRQCVSCTNYQIKMYTVATFSIFFAWTAASLGAGDDALNVIAGLQTPRGKSGRAVGTMSLTSVRLRSQHYKGGKDS